MMVEKKQTSFAINGLPRGIHITTEEITGANVTIAKRNEIDKFVIIPKK